MGGRKLHRHVLEKSVLRWTLDFLGGARAVTVITRSGDALPEDCRGATTAVAIHADRGMAWTLRAGFDAVEISNGAIVVLGDDPLAALALPDVLAARERHSGRCVAVQRTPFVPHPVYLTPESIGVFAPVMDGAAADRGLRTALEMADTVWVTTDAPTPIDVDTVDDLSRLTIALQIRDTPRG
jgi:CTP:molybdopterin cytidylyltransferase MocA